MFYWQNWNWLPCNLCQSHHGRKDMPARRQGVWCADTCHEPDYEGAEYCWSPCERRRAENQARSSQFVSIPGSLCPDCHCFRWKGKGLGMKSKAEILRHSVLYKNWKLRYLAHKTLQSHVVLKIAADAVPARVPLKERLQNPTQPLFSKSFQDFCGLVIPSLVSFSCNHHFDLVSNKTLEEEHFLTFIALTYVLTCVLT